MFTLQSYDLAIYKLLIKFFDGRKKYRYTITMSNKVGKELEFVYNATANLELVNDP